MISTLAVTIYGCVQYYSSTNVLAMTLSSYEVFSSIKSGT